MEKYKLILLILILFSVFNSASYIQAASNGSSFTNKHISSAIHHKVVAKKALKNRAKKVKTAKKKQKLDLNPPLINPAIGY